jgi:hypothetical protein
MIVNGCLEIEDELREILGIPEPLKSSGWAPEWP